VAGLLTLISAFGVPDGEADQVAAREKDAGGPTAMSLCGFRRA
jgi:hypothetical protein